MKPLIFLSAQFFLLTLSFTLFFDPVGISFFLLGLVWILNKKLAYLEVFVIFILKGQFGYMIASLDFMVAQMPVSVRTLFWLRPFLTVYMGAGFFYGSTMAVKLSGKLVKRQIKRKAPDLVEMING